MKYGIPMLVILYVVVIWPKSSGGVSPDLDLPEKQQAQIKQLGKPIQKNKKPFKKQIIGDNLKQKEVRNKTFLVTNEEAIEYNEQSEIVLEHGPGQNPAITKDDIVNKPQVRSAIEATTDPKKFASRLSPMFKASKFDKERFKNDANYRKEYIENPEPSRVWQEDMKAEYKLERLSNYYLEVFQNDEVEISVKAAPNMPVSILSTDLGRIKESGLTYATVIADGSGIATFTFEGMPGTFADSNVLISSPAARGQLKFIVNTKIKTEEKSN